MINAVTPDDLLTLRFKKTIIPPIQQLTDTPQFGSTFLATIRPASLN